MHNHFDIVSDDEDLLADALSIAMRSVAISATAPPAIGGWRVPEDMPWALFLHVGSAWPNSVTLHPFLTPLSAEDAAPMVLAWLEKAPREKVRHDVDVVYRNGYRIEVRPVTLDLLVTAVELEYHK